jgi:hypothetical protein
MGWVVIVGVVCCHGSQLANGATSVFLSTNVTTWSVCSHRVYKHPPTDYFFPGLPFCT